MPCIPPTRIRPQASLPRPEGTAVPHLLRPGTRLERTGGADRLDVDVLHTRRAPPDSARAPGHVLAGDLRGHVWRLAGNGTVFVCGPTAFVEAVSDHLVDLGRDPATIRTERFG